MSTSQPRESNPLTTGEVNFTEVDRRGPNSKDGVRREGGKGSVCECGVDVFL